VRRSEGLLLNRTPESKAAAKSARRIAPRDRKRPELSLGVLDGHLGYFLRRIQVWVFQDFLKTLARLDVRPAQYSVLAVIEANPGLSQSDLADFLGIERARLVRMLDRLEKRGFAKRKASPRDRRSHALFLTSEGQKALNRIKTVAAQHEANLTDKLGAENRKAMIEMLRGFGR
jgi:DNA-binding MarR family transcriptional regulator